MKRNGRHSTGSRHSVRLFKENEKRRVLLVGGGAREHALGEALCRSGRVTLYVFAHNKNPGLDALAAEYKDGSEKDVDAIVEWAREKAIDFAVIGLEDPLSVGVPDALIATGIPTVGPVQSAARLETSKLFLRNLMREHNIAGNLDFKYIADPDALETFIRANPGKEYALKPIGLTAGKGVQVMGVQLSSPAAAIEYGRSVIQTRLGGTAGILLEERIEGPEFTLQAFVDNSAVRPMPLVKDYKLAYEGDSGPNTGSMGSYSQKDGSLVFLSEDERRQAVDILDAVIGAVRGTAPYRGIVYGQFMKTRTGIKLIEINARFGDPEAINVLALLETDFVDVCEAIISDSLAVLPLHFSSKATVCKYLTPAGYPDAPAENEPITLDLSKIRESGVQVFFAKVAARGGAYYTTTSRSIALLAEADTVEEAHLKIESARSFVSGRFHMRSDIGSTALTELAVADWIPKGRKGSIGDRQALA